MSRNSCMFPEEAPYIYIQVLSLLSSILPLLNISIIFYPYRFALGLICGNVYLFCKTTDSLHVFVSTVGNC
jgi:hypothetical protein